MDASELHGYAYDRCCAKQPFRADVGHELPFTGIHGTSSNRPLGPLPLSVVRAPPGNALDHGTKSDWKGRLGRSSMQRGQANQF